MRTSLKESIGPFFAGLCSSAGMQDDAPNTRQYLMSHIIIYDESSSVASKPHTLAMHGQLAFSELVVCAVHAGHVDSDIDEGLCSTFNQLLQIGQSHLLLDVKVLLYLESKKAFFCWAVWVCRNPCTRDEWNAQKPCLCHICAVNMQGQLRLT